jgi:hypothetical protein
MAEREPIDMMTPRQHYGAATRMITEGLSKFDKIEQGQHFVTEIQRARAELVQAAHVHALLATVPQVQFDRWKREVDTERHVRVTTEYACGMCSRVLFRTNAEGSIERPTPVSSWETIDGVALCAMDDPDGCGQTGRATYHARYARRLQIGDTEPCWHGASPSRCRHCYHGADPSTVCGKCAVPCWNLRRTLGSRCGLPGCGGLMVAWPGPKP